MGAATGQREPEAASATREPPVAAGTARAALQAASASQAAAALRLARDWQAAGRLAPAPLLLVSVPGAGLALGPAGWRALVARAAALAPGAAFGDALCCADAPGAALAALRAGCGLVILDGAVPAFGQVAAAAAQSGARLLAARPPALDLEGLRLDREGGRARLAAWLSPAPHDSATPSG